MRDCFRFRRESDARFVEKKVPWLEASEDCREKRERSRDEIVKEESRRRRRRREPGRDCGGASNVAAENE